MALMWPLAPPRSRTVTALYCPGAAAAQMLVPRRIRETAFAQEDQQRKDALLLAAFAVGSAQVLGPETAGYAAAGRMGSASRAGLTTQCHPERSAVAEGAEPSQRGLPVHAEQHQLAERPLVVAACSEEVDEVAIC